MQSPWRGVLLTGLLHVASSAYFLRELRTTSPEMASSTVGWSLPHQSLQAGLQPDLMETFFLFLFFFSVCLNVARTSFDCLDLYLF